MPKFYKVLGQISPSANTDTTLYTCPTATQTTISTLSVCNRGSSAATYRVAIRPNGEAIADKHYIVFGTQVPANDTVMITVGLTCDAADVVTVQASTASVSFGLFGSEIA